MSLLQHNDLSFYSNLLPVAEIANASVGQAKDAPRLNRFRAMPPGGGRARDSYKNPHAYQHDTKHHSLPDLVAALLQRQTARSTCR
jgi:hypothetical protein